MELGSYENKLAYPGTVLKPSLKPGHTSAEALQYAKDLEVYEATLLKNKEERKQYAEESKRLIEKFKQDALKELGVEKHPKKEILWRLSWDSGHGSGLSEVWLELQELSELLVE